VSDRIDGVDQLGSKLSNAYSQAEQAAAGGARRSRTRRIAGGALALAATLFVVAAIVNRGPARGPERLLTVEQAVAAVASAAFDRPQAHSNESLYVSSRIVSAGGGRTRGVGAYTSLGSIKNERWYREGDKKGWIRTTVEPIKFASARDEAEYDKLNARVPKKNRTSIDPATWNAQSHEVVCRSALAGRGLGAQDAVAVLHVRDEAAIPTDPDKALELLLKSSGAGYVGAGGKYAAAWSSIGWAMEGGAPRLNPEQRAAVVGALAKIPGVTSLGRTTDPNGKEAIGFARNEGNTRQRLYFDAKTSLTTYSDSSVRKRMRVGFTKPPVGTTIWSYSLLDYRYLTALPALKASDPKKLDPMSAMMCPKIRHVKRRS
jgi:hypothetical protein